MWTHCSQSEPGFALLRGSLQRFQNSPRPLPVPPPSQGTLAIDLGTSTTLVGWQSSAGSPLQLLSLPPLSAPSAAAPLIPSLVLPTALQPLVGQQVVDAGRPPGTLAGFKTRLAGTADDDGARWAAERLLDAIWNSLPAGVQPHRLVLTAPVEGYQPYRRWLAAWAEALPVDEVALVDESTAAALGAGLAPGSVVLVLDMGAGTTDLSLVRLEGGQGRAAPMAELLRFGGRPLLRPDRNPRCARVLGKAGLGLGGQDIDRWWAEALGAPQPPPPDWLQAAEQLKCALSSADSAAVTLLGPSARLLRGRRGDLEQVLERCGLPEQLEGLMASVEAAARRAGLGDSGIDAVLAVGGGSQLPWLRRWLEQRLPGRLLPGDRPLEAVVRGALAMTPALQVKDVLSRGVSLRIWDRRQGRRRWHPLYLAGQAWPTPDPLELVLRAGEAETALELQLGTIVAGARGEVVMIDDRPVLRAGGEGGSPVTPWPGPPLRLPLGTAGQDGDDRLRLRFRIDDRRQLWVEGEELPEGQAIGVHRLGILD